MPDSEVTIRIDADDPVMVATVTEPDGVHGLMEEYYIELSIPDLQGLKGVWE